MTEQQLYELQNRQKQMGVRGEDFVLAYEQQRLAGHPLLAQVRIAGRGDVGLGYDIMSFNDLASTEIDRLIEVKTYNGTPHFFFSEGEEAASRKYGEMFFLYIVDLSQVLTPDYKPFIIQDPHNNLEKLDSWQGRKQTTEYTFVGKDSADNIPEDFDDATVVVGCFNDSNHLTWILHNHCYNVRASVPGRQVNGAVNADELTMGAKYLLLYNVQSPRSYSMYKVSKTDIASNGTLRLMGYKSPHCPNYLLYHLRCKVEFPELDIMQILRTNNDKVQRTSGTPIYLLGREMRRYLVSVVLNPYNEPSFRKYSNAGAPWTKVQDIKLTDWLAEKRDIGYIALRLHREPQEIIDRINLLGLSITHQHRSNI